jgi:hypothetical protein
MIRIVLASALIALALPVSAEEKARDPRVEALLKDLPSEAELDKAMDEMPDLNRLMGGMLEIMKDEATQAKMKSIGERMAQKMDGKDFRSAEGELPDFNAIMREMMGLMGDQDLIGDVAALGIALEDEMKSLAEDAAPENTGPGASAP